MFETWSEYLSVVILIVVLVVAVRILLTSFFGVGFGSNSLWRDMIEYSENEDE